MIDNIFPQKQFCKGELLYLVLALLFVFAAGAAASVESLQSTDEDQLLQPGIPVTRQITARQVHSFRIQLTARQFLRTVISEWGLTVEVSISDPKGRQIAAVRSRSEGLTPISCIATVDGFYN